MGIVAVILIAGALWLAFTGRLQRMSGLDGMMIGIAIVGAVMAAKGRPVIGGLPLIAAVGYSIHRSRTAKKNRAKPMSPARFAAAMDAAEARALLGVGPQANRAEIKSAHRRLIATVHPDKGGTEALAAKINAARDVLLKEQKN